MVLNLALLKTKGGVESSGDWEHQENNKSEHHNVEQGDGGKNETTEVQSIVSGDKDDMKVNAIMVGYDKDNLYC